MPTAFHGGALVRAFEVVEELLGEIFEELLNLFGAPPVLPLVVVYAVPGVAQEFVDRLRFPENLFHAPPSRTRVLLRVTSSARIRRLRGRPGLHPHGILEGFYLAQFLQRHLANHSAVSAWLVFGFNRDAQPQEILPEEEHEPPGL